MRNVMLDRISQQMRQERGLWLPICRNGSWWIGRTRGADDNSSPRSFLRALCSIILLESALSSPM